MTTDLKAVSGTIRCTLKPMRVVRIKVKRWPTRSEVTLRMPNGDRVTVAEGESVEMTLRLNMDQDLS